MVKVMIFSIVLLLTLLDMSTALRRNTLFQRRKIDKRIVATIFHSDFDESTPPGWYGAEGKPTNLRNLPPYVNTVIIATAKPNMKYLKGSYFLPRWGNDVGLRFPYEGKDLAESMVSLKRKNITVLLSIGGRWNWYNAVTNGRIKKPNPNADCYKINYEQIQAFVDDFAFDGIVWDYQPGGSINYLSDQFHVDKYIELITKSRKVMPRNQGYLIGSSPAGVGAMGGNVHKDISSPYGISNPPRSDPKTGHFIPVIKAAGSQLDLITYNGFNRDANVMYDSFAYYGNIYKFKIVAGVYHPEYTNNLAGELAAYIKHAGKRGKRSIGNSEYDGVMVSELSNYMNRNSKNGYKLCIINYLILIQGESVADSLIAAGKNLDIKNYNGQSSYKDLLYEDKYCGAVEWQKQVYARSGKINVYYQGSIYQNRGWYTPAYFIPGSSFMWIFQKACPLPPYTNLESVEGRPKYPYNPYGEIAIKMDVQTGKWEYTKCDAYVWVQHTRYTKNTKVYYKGKVWLWELNGDSLGSRPMNGGFGWLPLGTCSNQEVYKAYCDSTSIAPWDSRKTYTSGGYVVSYMGKTYKNGWFSSAGTLPTSGRSGWSVINPDHIPYHRCDAIEEIRGAGANEDIAHSSDSDNSGSIIPIVIPVLVVVTLVLAALGFYYQRRKKSNEANCNLQNFESELV